VATNFSAEELYRQAQAFQRSTAWRNRSEYAFGALAIGVFTFYIWAFPFWLIRAGCVLTILGTLVMLHQMQRRASSQTPPSASGAMSCLDFHRAALARQRDALRSVWLWYIGPLVPGIVVFRLGVGSAVDIPIPSIYGWIANLFVASVLLTIVVVNRRAANRLQCQLDQLDAQAGRI
jgi:membrane protein YdbS with pleckstrin-like domain